MLSMYIKKQFYTLTYFLYIQNTNVCLLNLLEPLCYNKSRINVWWSLFFALQANPLQGNEAGIFSAQFKQGNESKEVPADIFRDMDVFAQHVDRILENRHEASRFEVSLKVVYIHTRPPTI